MLTKSIFKAMKSILAAIFIRVLFFISALLLVLSLSKCKKSNASTAQKSYIVTFKVTGTGNYHYQSGGITRSGHVTNAQSFVEAAQPGNNIELDATNDSISKPISIEIDCSPSIPSGNQSKSGLGNQQISFTL